MPGGTSVKKVETVSKEIYMDIQKGIPFKTKLENGASMNVMGRGRTTAWGDTLRRLDTYYIYADKKEADQASYIIRQALHGTKK